MPLDYLDFCGPPARRFHKWMTSAASRAATSVPPAPYNAASKLGTRSGVNACKPSSSAAVAMRMGPTRSGRGQAKQTTDVANEKAEEVIALPAEARAEELPFGGNQ